jgi:hypothetical protein
MKKMEVAEIEVIQAQMKKIVANANKMELAQLVGEPYDPELPVNSVIADILETSSVAPELIFFGKIIRCLQQHINVCFGEVCFLFHVSSIPNLLKQ